MLSGVSTLLNDAATIDIDVDTSEPADDASADDALADED
jgi:hypothetical protein